VSEHTAEAQLRAELLLARRHAHTTDAERAEAEARLHETRAALEMSRAREARTHAAAVNAQAAVAQVRRLCDLTIESSVRVQAVTQARDTLAVVDACMAGRRCPETRHGARCGSTATGATSPAR
jgi:hypothetical protein